MHGRNVTYARDNFKSAALRSGEMSQSVSKSNKLKAMEYRYRELNVIPGGITWDRILFFPRFRYFSPLLFIDFQFKAPNFRIHEKK